MINKEAIRDFYGRVIGYIETDRLGNQIGRDFYNVIVGYYFPKENVTRDFYRRIVGRGNLLSSLIYIENEKRENEKNKR